MVVYKFVEAQFDESVTEPRIVPVGVFPIRVCIKHDNLAVTNEMIDLLFSPN